MSLIICLVHRLRRKLAGTCLFLSFLSWPNRIRDGCNIVLSADTAESSSPYIAYKSLLTVSLLKSQRFTKKRNVHFFCQTIFSSCKHGQTESGSHCCLREYWKLSGLTLKKSPNYLIDGVHSVDWTKSFSNKVTLSRPNMTFFDNTRNIVRRLFAVHSLQISLFLWLWSIDNEFSKITAITAFLWCSDDWPWRLTHKRFITSRVKIASISRQLLVFWICRVAVDFEPELLRVTWSEICASTFHSVSVCLTFDLRRLNFGPRSLIRLVVRR